MLFVVSAQIPSEHEDSPESTAVDTIPPGKITNSMHCMMMQYTQIFVCNKNIMCYHHREASGWYNEVY